LILVYWASMVNVVLTDDGVQLIPEFPQCQQEWPGALQNARKAKRTGHAF
jgi:hypothetical protein